MISGDTGAVAIEQAADVAKPESPYMEIIQHFVDEFVAIDAFACDVRDVLGEDAVNATPGLRQEIDQFATKKQHMYMQVNLGLASDKAIGEFKDMTQNFVKLLSAHCQETGVEPPVFEVKENNADGLDLKEKLCDNSCLILAVTVKRKLQQATCEIAKIYESKDGRASKGMEEAVTEKFDNKVVWAKSEYTRLVKRVQREALNEGTDGKSADVNILYDAAQQVDTVVRKYLQELKAARYKVDGTVIPSKTERPMLSVVGGTDTDGKVSNGRGPRFPGDN